MPALSPSIYIACPPPPAPAPALPKASFIVDCGPSQAATESDSADLIWIAWILGGWGTNCIRICRCLWLHAADWLADWLCFGGCHLSEPVLSQPCFLSYNFHPSVSAFFIQITHRYMVSCSHLVYTSFLSPTHLSFSRRKQRQVLYLWTFAFVYSLIHNILNLSIYGNRWEYIWQFNSFLKPSRGSCFFFFFIFISLPIFIVLWYYRRSWIRVSPSRGECQWKFPSSVSHSFSSHYNRPSMALIPFKLAAVVANRIHSTRDSLGMDLGKVTHNEQKVAVKSLWLTDWLTDRASRKVRYRICHVVVSTVYEGCSISRRTRIKDRLGIELKFVYK